MISSRLVLRHLCAAVLVAGIALSCDPSVTIIREDDRTFSVVGLLDAAKDTQYVRVEHLRDSVALGAPRELDATVTVRNLDTGETTQFRDSVYALRGDSILAHVFSAPLQPTPGHRYELRVTAPSGASTTHTTTVPERPPDLAAPPVLLSCTVDGPSGGYDASITATITGVPRVVGPRAQYRVYGRTHGFSHSDSTDRQGETRFRSTVVFERDLEAIGGRCDGCPCLGAFDPPVLFLIAATTGPEGPPNESTIPPGGRFPRPRNYSNVDGGVGFFGGIYSDTLRVPIRETPR